MGYFLSTLQISLWTHSLDPCRNPPLGVFAFSFRPAFLFAPNMATILMAKLALSATSTAKSSRHRCRGHHTFSAFWLWSSVVSVLISVTTDILPTGRLLVTPIFLWGGCSLSLLEGTSRVALALHFARCGTPLGVINSYLLFSCLKELSFGEKLSGVACENTQKSMKTLWLVGGKHTKINKNPVVGMGKTHKNQ